MYAVIASTPIDLPTELAVLINLGGLAAFVWLMLRQLKENKDTITAMKVDADAREKRYEEEREAREGLLREELSRERQSGEQREMKLLAEMDSQRQQFMADLKEKREQFVTGLRENTAAICLLKEEIAEIRKMLGAGKGVKP